MKVYFNMCTENLVNCYVVVNEDSRQAIIIDPGIITQSVIDQIEDGDYDLVAVLITHEDDFCYKGIATLQKIYSIEVFCANTENLLQKQTTLLGQGKIKIAGLDIEYFSMPGSGADSICFKIGKFIFSGDTLSSGIVGDIERPIHSKRILLKNIKEKIFTKEDDALILSSFGPPITVAAQKQIIS